MLYTSRAGGNTIQVVPAPDVAALRHTSLDSVHVSNSGSGSNKSKVHVRSNSSPGSETSQQLSRPISRVSGDPNTSRDVMFYDVIQGDPQAVTMLLARHMDQLHLVLNLVHNLDRLPGHILMSPESIPECPAGQPLEMISGIIPHLAIY